MVKLLGCNVSWTYHIGVVGGTTKYTFSVGFLLRWIVLYPSPNGGLRSEVPLASYILEYPPPSRGLGPPGASAAFTLFLFSREGDLERPSGDLIANMYLKYTMEAEIEV